MKLDTILKRIEEQSTIEDFMKYIESKLIEGTTVGIIAKNSPVKMGGSAITQLLDLWYPGYSELSVPEKRQWKLTQWPTIYVERKQYLRLHDADHPIYKHFTYKNAMNFHGQKTSAKKRNIDFQFDFLTWIFWWINTGKFDQRGVHGYEYQMCRKGDIGPYHWDNVYCDTGDNNKADYWVAQTIEKVV